MISCCLSNVLMLFKKSFRNTIKAHSHIYDIMMQPAMLFRLTKKYNPIYLNEHLHCMLNDSYHLTLCAMLMLHNVACWVIAFLKCVRALRV